MFAEYFCKIENLASGEFKEKLDVFSMHSLEENTKHFDRFNIEINMANSQNIASISVKAIILIILLGV